jgi:hypothetical protein
MTWAAIASGVRWASSQQNMKVHSRGDDMSSNEEIWKSKLIEFLPILGVLAIVYLVYQHNKVNELSRWSDFQSYLVNCECIKAGSSYKVDGVEETNYICKKYGGSISNSEFQRTIYGIYDPREHSDALCPDR